MGLNSSLPSGIFSSSLWITFPPLLLSGAYDPPILLPMDSSSYSSVWPCLWQLEWLDLFKSLYLLCVLIYFLLPLLMWLLSCSSWVLLSRIGLPMVRANLACLCFYPSSRSIYSSNSLSFTTLFTVSLSYEKSLRCGLPPEVIVWSSLWWLTTVYLPFWVARQVSERFIFSCLASLRSFEALLTRLITSQQRIIFYSEKP
jgi:hypothetical protein